LSLLTVFALSAACSDVTTTGVETTPEGRSVARDVMIDPLNAVATGCTDYLGFWHPDVNACTTGGSPVSGPPPAVDPNGGGGGAGGVPPAPFPAMMTKTERRRTTGPLPTPDVSL
jgi:hypothetical protein